MCWCSPNLRTPCCGGVDCLPPQRSTISNNTILQQSQLQLWQSYCDKKVECEIMKELLKEASILLTEGTLEHCTELATKIDNYLEE